MNLKFTSALAAILLTLFGASAAGLNGSRYQGIAKIKGQPIDCWVDMNFDDTDIEFNIANTFNFGAGYTLNSAGDNWTVTAKVPGSAPAKLTSDNGGGTLQGNISLNGNSLALWVLKVPATLTPSDKPAAELEKVIGDADGYTAFVIIDLPGGQKMCATSEISFDAANKTYKMSCDSPSLQKIFSTAYGSYKVEGSSLVLTDAAGHVTQGSIYDDGYYLKAPMGSESGITLTLVMIK